MAADIHILLMYVRQEGDPDVTPPPPAPDPPPVFPPQEDPVYPIAVATDDVGVYARRINYACCALEYAKRMINGYDKGDMNCYEQNRRLWLYMLWAKGIADETEMCGTGCYTKEYSSGIFKDADCFCTIYGETACAPDPCPVIPPTNPPDPPPVDPPPGPTDCVVQLDYLVIAAVDSGDMDAIEAGPPAPGDSYFVITENTINPEWPVGTIQTWNGTGWDSVNVQPGEVVQSAYFPPGPPPGPNYAPDFNNDFNDDFNI